MRLAMAPCGIDCNACTIYRAAFETEQADLLVPWFKSNGWVQPEEGIAEIMARIPFCKGCLGDRTVQWTGNCAIRLCCTEEKGLVHCGECADFPCARLNEWAASDGHLAALENLKRIRDRIE